MNPGELKLKEKIGERDDCFFPDIPKCEIKNIEDRFRWCVDIKIRKNGGCLEYHEDPELEELFGKDKPVYGDSVKRIPIPNKKVVDVVELLSKLERNTLIPYHNGRIIEGDEVTTQDLKGKHIILCCFFVPCFWGVISTLFVQAVSLASHELYGNKDFEMVVVVKMRKDWENDLGAFNHFMSAFSCLAVPFTHSSCRESICCSLNFETDAQLLIVDPHHNVLREEFNDFGAEDLVSLPLTASEEKFRERKFTSLEQLLYPCRFLHKTCHQKGVVEEKVVPISVLEGKLVGFYLLCNGWDFLLLEKVYKDCRVKGLEFEIVILYLPYLSRMLPESYHQLCNRVFSKLNLSWWILPFNNTVYRRLWLICQCEMEDKLIVMEAGGKAAYASGLGILREAGVKGYPFTVEGLIRNEMNRKQSLTLRSLLPCEYVYRPNQERVRVEELRGKNIIVYLSLLIQDLYNPIVDWYKEFKRKHPDFEMILVNLNVPLLTSPSLPPNMPWLVCPSNTRKSLNSVINRYYSRRAKSESLAAFGEDGQFRSICSPGRLSAEGLDVFPFSSDLKKGVISHLYDQGYECMWDVFLHLF